MSHRLKQAIKDSLAIAAIFAFIVFLYVVVAPQLGDAIRSAIQ